MSLSIKHVALDTLKIIEWHGKGNEPTLAGLLEGAKVPPWKVVKAVGQLMQDGAVAIHPDGRVCIVTKWVEW